MFWNSVLGGLGVLSHGKLWLGVFLLVVAQFAFLLITSLILGPKESGKRQAAGCLFMSLGGPLYQGIIMSIFVGFYLPIMLGADEIMPATVVLGSIWPLTKAGLLAVVTVTILCIVPILGGLIAESPGIQNFLIGAIVFRLLAGAALEEFSKTYPNASVYPNIWAIIGYLIIAGVLVRIILFAGVLTSTAVKNRTGSELAESLLGAIAPSIAVLGGVLPLFMYAQHVRLTVRAVTGQ